MMKYLIRVLISLVPLFIISLATNEVSANSEQYSQVRTVRRLAIRENLDSENLATLEYLYFTNVERPSSVTQLSPDVSTNCNELKVMTLLAQISEGNSDLTRMVKTQQKVTCQTPQQNSRSSFDWSNGERAKFGLNWYYPNGEKAKFGSNWYYPNGEKAKFGLNWYYPNGEKAKFGSNWYYPNREKAKFGSIWYYPNGRRASSANSLFAWACDLVGRGECNNIRFEGDSSNNLLNNLTIIELLWKVSQISNSQN
ncbi:MAG: hypothetical protein F6K41_02335 [Symploca sp. SIO3E6]|nr:hypothetical protein [Caldora sp. SIO3E6]